jgi:monoamine oxidase
MERNANVIVVGAGAAGLAAASRLGRGGLSVVLLEARDRIGGRIFTQHDSTLRAPIELGAEFIHGKPPEIWEPLQHAGVQITELGGESWCATTEKLSPCDSFSEIDSILDKMDDSLPDESFLTFLERTFPNPADDRSLAAAKQRALGYVSGFNAADPALIGVHWLVQSMRAEERIEGYRAFRAENGYARLMEIFRRQISDANVVLHTSTVVEVVKWWPGAVAITARTSDGQVTFHAQRALITLPLAVLQAPMGEAGAVQFSPSLPRSKQDALGKLEMGKVIRIVLGFRERFWDSLRHPARVSLSDMGFLFSQDEWFPTWWTTMPKKLPIITGWAPFHAGEKLSGRQKSFVVERSLETLGRLLRMDARKLENCLDAAYFHDWQSDPFSGGAYSYGKVGSDGAQEALASPLENTLFFAGEATDITGNNGTVHGAIASGERAAKEILRG